MIKRLALILALLFAAPAYAQYVRDDCSTVTPAATFKGTCYDYNSGKFKYWDSNSWEDITTGGGGGSGAPTDVNYLVGTADGDLSNEIVVGTSPGGELGGTWASPTVDATHSGSSHAGVQAAAEATAAAALSAHASDSTSIHGIADTSVLETTSGAQAKVDTHVNDTTDAHDASAISVDSTNLAGTGTDVQTVLEELEDQIDTAQATADNHIADATAAHAATAIAVTPFSSIAATTVQAALEEIVSEATGGLTSADIDTSAELRAIVGDETGTGALVFAGGDIGAATATTPSANDNDTSVATTAYVQTELTAYASDSKTLTNTSLDAEGTGNALTIPFTVWMPVAGCNGATAAPIWDLPSSNPAVAACTLGTNSIQGTLDFADASNLSAQNTWMVPSDWTGAIDARIKWFSSQTSGDVVWQLSTSCVADAETNDPAFNTASPVTDTTKGTTNQLNDATISNVTVTGCAAGELMHVKIQRDSGHASDSMAGTARLIGIEFTYRRAM